MENLRIFFLLICSIFFAGKTDGVPTGLSCYRCLDLEIADRDLPPEVDPVYQQFYGMLLMIHYDGIDPGSCKSPQLTRCDTEQSCYVLKAESDSPQLGVRVKANLTFSYCLDRTKPALHNIPEEGCVDTRKAFADLIGPALFDLPGVACSCPTTGCNDPRLELGPIECQSLTCENGGTCLVSIDGDENCECSNWYTGDRCQRLKKFRCGELSPCHDDEPLYAKDGIRHFPHLTRADKFVQCGAKGRCFERTCDHHLVWDYQAQACSWPTKTRGIAGK